MVYDKKVIQGATSHAVVGRGSEAQLCVGKKVNSYI